MSYCECGRHISISFSRKNGNAPTGALSDPRHHDLCSKCERRLKQQVIAQRMSGKPVWAYNARSTLTVMQAATHGGDGVE